MSNSKINTIMCKLCENSWLDRYEVSITGCPKLRIVESGSIETLALTDIKNLHYISDSCASLTSLSVIDCPNLFHIGNLKQLTRLEIQNCPKLQLPPSLPRLCTLTIDGSIFIGDTLEALDYPSLCNLQIKNYHVPLTISSIGQNPKPYLSNLLLSNSSQIDLYRLQLSTFLCCDSTLINWSILSSSMKPTSFILLKNVESIESLGEVELVTLYIENCPNLWNLPATVKHLNSFNCPNIVLPPLDGAVVVEIDGKIVHSL